MHFQGVAWRLAASGAAVAAFCQAQSEGQQAQTAQKYSVFDRNGNRVVGTQKVVNLKLKDQTPGALPAGGIMVKTNLNVSIGDYVVRDSEWQITPALVNIP